MNNGRLGGARRLPRFAASYTLDAIPSFRKNTHNKQMKFTVDIVLGSKFSRLVAAIPTRLVYERKQRTDAETNP